MHFRNIPGYGNIPATVNTKSLVYRMCEKFNGCTSQSSVTTIDIDFILVESQEVKWNTDKEVQYMSAAW